MEDSKWEGRGQEGREWGRLRHRELRPKDQLQGFGSYGKLSAAGQMDYNARFDLLIAQHVCVCELVESLPWHFALMKEELVKRDYTH